MSQDWIAKIVAELKGLRGQVVEEAWIWEMAFIEADAQGEPVFVHAECPFLQAGVLYLMCSGALQAITTYQNTRECGLLLRARPDSQEVAEEEVPGSIYRTRRVGEFPRGEITGVLITQSATLDVAEVVLTIGSRSVLLKAGEVEENNDGSLSILRGDESVLVFLDPDDKNRVFK